ncbi:MAG: flagellar assembly protein FliX [Alphaproteobacteria bacterium]|nr:flagellar assembly protein FliX [Alphaproteobacteria bacterium]
MIQVGDINKIKDSSLSKTKKTTSGGNFSAYLQDIMQTSSEAISGASPLSPADAIFAAQMVGEEEEKTLRKKQLERGQTLLDKLEAIRNGLLRGYIAKEELMDIMKFVREQKFEAQDSRINEIVEEIELRVEVELAKLMK